MKRKILFNLEPTFRCNLGCEMCPRFSSEDAFLDMSAHTYDRIHAAMDSAHTVDYTGWGEPTLHRGIYDMVRRAHERGCRTTMTSNGTTLNQRNRRRLIESGLDVLTVSIDGIQAETYDRIRIGASLDRVADHLRNLSEETARLGSGPQLGIAFTIQQDNAGDILGVPEWVRSVGATVMHLKQLNVTSNREDWERSFLKYRLPPLDGNGDALAQVEQDMQRAARKGREMGLEVHLHSQLPLTEEMAPRYCLAAPLDTVYFSYQGQVAPCCHFGHHVSRYFEGRLYPPSALFYGDINRDDFRDIWETEAFAAFRVGFRNGNFPQECRNCYLLYGK